MNNSNIGIKFSVIDKGFTACTTSLIVEQLKNLDEYHPDIVITMLGINDDGQHMLYKLIPKTNFKRNRCMNLLN